MKEKSHQGQRHKGCGLCDREKRAGNGAERRPHGDHRQMADEFGSALKGSLTLIAEDDEAYFSPGEWLSADKGIL